MREYHAEEMAPQSWSRSNSGILLTHGVYAAETREGQVGKWRRYCGGPMTAAAAQSLAREMNEREAKPMTDLPTLADLVAALTRAAEEFTALAALLQDHDGHAERAAEIREAAATIEASLGMLAGPT